MVLSFSSSAGYTDVVAKTANNDFHQDICIHRDDDIRTTFIQASPIALDSGVQVVAVDSHESSTFLKTFRVPYITALLARSTLPIAKQCNGERAQNQLKIISADLKVYKRHSDKLCRYWYNNVER